MSKNVNTTNLSFDDELIPAQFIFLMFDRTDENGILYIPGWNCNFSDDADKESIYRCRMNWNVTDCKKTADEFNTLYNNLQKIAAVYDELDGSVENATEVLESDGLFQTWNTYIRRFDTGNIDIQQILDIEDRVEIVNWLDELSQKGEEMSEYEKNTMKEYMDVSVSEDELQILDDYRDAVFNDAEKRVGKNICAFDFVVRTMRLCRLMNLHAPEAVTGHEARECAAAMVIHKFGISREKLDINLWFNMAKFEQLLDQETE